MKANRPSHYMKDVVKVNSSALVRAAGIII